MAAAMLNMFLDGVVTPETVIVGLGKTGLSCARFLRRRGWPVTVMDSRHEPAGLETLRRELPEVPTVLGGLDKAVLAGAGLLQYGSTDSAAGLAQRMACTTLRNLVIPQTTTHRVHGTTPSLGVYKFGRDASFRIWMSNAWSATSRLSRAFSFSNALNCLAICGSIPPYFVRQR